MRVCQFLFSRTLNEDLGRSGFDAVRTRPMADVDQRVWAAALRRDKSCRRPASVCAEVPGDLCTFLKTKCACCDPERQPAERVWLLRNRIHHLSGVNVDTI